MMSFIFIFSISGIIFTLTGVSVLLLIPQQEGDIKVLYIIGILFTLIGSVLLRFAIRGIKDLLHRRRVLKKGRSITATVVDYEKGSIEVNGKRTVAVVMEFIPTGSLEPVRLSFETEKFDSGLWPVGSTTRIFCFEETYAWDKIPTITSSEVEERSRAKFL